jgi:hypothetical protein
MGRKEEILLVVKEQTEEKECDAAARIRSFPHPQLLIFHDIHIQHEVTKTKCIIV